MPSWSDINSSIQKATVQANAAERRANTTANAGSQLNQLKDAVKYGMGSLPSSGGGYGGYYGSGGGGSMAPTDIERQAAERLKDIARYNADATRAQLGQQLSNYDLANQQNRSLADVQLKQNQRTTSADRFEAQRDLQNSALGLLGSMNQAMNGSSVGNLMRMLEDRNDKDNNTYWAQHQVNQDTIENSYLDSLNQNVTAKNDAVINAQKALSDIQGDLSANLNNINPELYVAPGTGDANLGAGNVYDQNRVAANNAQISGYVMPDNRRGAERNRLLGNDYYSRLINSFNGR